MVKQINIDTPVKNAHCPRCGYDLRGIVETWENACDISGTCSECGLEFNWSEVLHPEKYEALWCVEFRNAGWFPHAVLKTYLMSFRPWRFWRELKMANAVRWRRLLAHVLILIFFLLTFFVIEQSTVAILAWRLCQQEIISQQIWAKQTIPRFQQQLDELKATEDAPAEKIASWQSDLDSRKIAATNLGSVNITLKEALIEAVFFPLRRKSQGLVITPIWIQYYPAPINLHGLIMVRKNRVIQLYHIPDQYLRKIKVSVIMQLVLFPGIPLAFFLMPASRRMAKVRWDHILRVLLYSLFLPITTFCLLVVLFSMGILVSELESICYKVGKILFTYATWIALIAWWAIATKHYFKMLHGWIVSLVFSFLIMLTTLLALFFFAPLLVDDIWTWF